MPLPPALAARLAKRGIIPKDTPGSTGKDSRDDDDKQEEEEVFAESYDEHQHQHPPGSRGYPRPLSSDSGKPSDKAGFMGYPGCPNKWNVYHDCELFCLRHFGQGHVQPDPEYVNKHKKMMDKYGPLPDDWKEQYDPGSGRHFYWCTRTDRVSWFPPGHPKTKPMEAASVVREVIQSQMAKKREEEEDEDQAMELDSDVESDEDEEDLEVEERRRHDKDKLKEEGEHFRGRERGQRGRDLGKLDPMDPSSYSDAPRGTWSSGLEKARDS